MTEDLGSRATMGSKMLATEKEKPDEVNIIKLLEEIKELVSNFI